MQEAGLHDRADGHDDRDGVAALERLWSLLVVRADESQKQPKELGLGEGEDLPSQWGL